MSRWKLQGASLARRVFLRLRTASWNGPLPILTVALGVRVVYFMSYRHSPFFEVYVVDQLYYRTWALWIAAGEWLGRRLFEQGPLYAYLLGAAYRLLGARDALILPLQLLAGLGTIMLIWWCARCLQGSRVSAAAGLLAAIYGPFIFYECMIMKTFLEPLLVMAALAVGLRGLETARPRWFAFAGASVGLLCLVREVHLLLLVPLLVAAWRPGVRAPQRGSRLLSAGAMLLAFLLVLAPSTLRNWVVTREFVVSTAGGGEAIYLAFGPHNTGYYSAPDFISALPFLEHQDFRDEAFFRTRTPMSQREFSHYWYREGLKAVFQAPGRALRLVFAKALILFYDVEIPDSEDYKVTGDFMPWLKFLPTFGWISGLGFLGVFLAMRRGGRALLPLGFAAVLIVEVLLTYNFGRFRTAFCAVWLLFAGWGLAWLLATARRRGRGDLLRFSVIVMGVLILAALSRLPPPGSEPELSRARAAFKKDVLVLAERHQAISAIRMKLTQIPGSPDLLNALGEALEDSGKYPEAVAAYEEALRLKPDAMNTRRNLAVINFNMGELDGAARQAEAMVRDRPDLAEGYYLLGMVDSRRGTTATDAASSSRLLAEAQTLLEKALSLNPEDAEAHYRLGRVLYLRGEVRDALRELTWALRIAPDHPAALRDRRSITSGGVLTERDTS